MKSLKSDPCLLLAYLCFFGLPLLAIGLIGFCAYGVASVGGYSPWLIVPLAMMGGAAILGIGIAASGTDMTDFAVSSIIVIVLTITLMPIFMRARENAHRQAIKQALQEHGAIYPQPKWKGPQRNR